jgi:hypothetical protein
MVAGLVLVLSVAAGAQEGAELEAFKEHVQRGAELRDSGELHAALEEFQQARAIADHPRFARVIGRIHEELGDCSAARREFEAGLADERADQTHKERLTQALEENDACVDRGALTVECSPANVTLAVGDDEFGCPVDLELEAGQTTLVASAPEHEDQEVVVDVEPGAQHHQQITLDQPVAQEVSPVTYAKFGALGLGGALILGGVLSDASATTRQDELAEASRQGDLSAANQLADEADSARTRTIALYSVGSVLAIGGAALWYFDDEAEAWLRDMTTESNTGAHISVGADGASVGATFRW